MNYSKSKFENEAAERLYGLDEDESIGAVHELGHARRFDDELSVLIEDNVGFVWIDEFDSADELREAWADIERQYDEYYNGLLV